MKQKIFSIIIISLILFSCENKEQTSEVSKQDTIKNSNNDSIKSIFIKPDLVTKYNLGEKYFFEEQKDSQSYLPIDFIYNNKKIYFIPGKSRNFEYRNGNIEYLPEKNRNLIIYDLVNNKNIDNENINKFIAKNIKNDSYVEKLFIKDDTGLILFNNYSLMFSQTNNKLNISKGVDYVFPSKHSNFYYLNNNKLSEIDFYGKVIMEKDIKSSINKFEYYYYNDTIYTTEGKLFDIADIANDKLIQNINVKLSSEEIISKYVLLGVSDKYTIWVANAISSENLDKINELLFFDKKTGKLNYNVTIDKNILNAINVDQTFYPEYLKGTDPPELRQYLRLCFGDGKYYLMFQSKKVIYIYSFSLPSF